MTTVQKPGHFQFVRFLLVPDWAPGAVQMRWDGRDIDGRALKVGFGCVFVGKKSLFVEIQVSALLIRFQAFDS